MSTSCFTTISELKNRVLLQNNIPNTDKISEQIVVWAFEAQRQMATGGMFQTLEKEFDADDKLQFRIPNEVYKIEDLRIGDTPSYYTGFPKLKSCNSGCCCGCNPCTCVSWYQGGRYLNFGQKVGCFTLAYTGIATDDDGFPVIDEDHIDSIAAYVDYMLFYIRWKEGKVSYATIKELKRTYLSKFRAARAKDNLPSEAEARTLSRIMNSKLPILSWSYDCVDSSGGCSSVCDNSGTTVEIIKNVTEGVFTCLDPTYGDGSTTYTFSQLVGVPQNNILLYLDGTLGKNGQEIVSYNSTTGTFTLNGGYDGLEIRICYYPNS